MSRVSVVWLPARSRAVAVRVCVPTAELYPVTSHPASPESASVASQIGDSGTDPNTWVDPSEMSPTQASPGAVASRRMVVDSVSETLPARSAERNR